MNGSNGSSNGTNGSSYSAPVDSREGFVERRFHCRSPPKTYKTLPSLLSIISLIVMTVSALFMAKELSNTSVAFHQLNIDEIHTGGGSNKHGKIFGGRNGNKDNGKKLEVNTFKELMEVVPCFFGASNSENPACTRTKSNGEGMAAFL